MDEKKNLCLKDFENFVLKSEKLSIGHEERALNERDIGFIGNNEFGLRALNKFESDDIRGVLIYIQDWELKNGLREKEEQLELMKQ